MMAGCLDKPTEVEYPTVFVKYDFKRKMLLSQKTIQTSIDTENDIRCHDVRYKGEKSFQSVT